jgi:hypothetical protein
MTAKLQELFGTDPARVYEFTASVPEDINPVAHITEAFATAAGSNLINCIVTEVSGNWLVYTKETEVTSDKFTLVVELPLPEPEPEVPEVPAEPTEETP